MGKLTAARVRAINAAGQVLRPARPHPAGGARRIQAMGLAGHDSRTAPRHRAGSRGLHDAGRGPRHRLPLPQGGAGPEATPLRCGPTPPSPPSPKPPRRSSRPTAEAGRTAASSEDSWRSSLQRYAYSQIGSTPVDEITTADLARVLLPIWHEKRETARKVKTRLGVVMRWAIAEGHRSDDPAGPALTGALPRHSGTPAKHFASLPYGEAGRGARQARLLSPNVAPGRWPVCGYVRRHCRSQRRGQARRVGGDRPRHQDLDCARWAHQDRPRACGAAVAGGGGRTR